MKLYGRNMLIGRKILDLTGEGRERKQISSHIQVVKKFLKADRDQCKLAHSGSTLSRAYCFAVLGSVQTDPARVEAVDSKSIEYDQIAGILMIKDPVSTSLACHSRPRIRSSFAPSWRQCNQAAAASSITSTPAMLIQSVSFSMLLHGPGDEVLHTFTTMQSDVGTQQRSLDDTLTDMFPDLAKCLSGVPDNQCEVILFDSSINFIQQRPQSGSNLAIHYSVDFTSCHDQAGWRFRTTRYESKGKYVMHRTSPPEQGPELKIERLATDRYRLLEAPLMSDWWVEIFTKALDRRNRVAAKERIQVEELGHGVWSVL